MAMGEDGTKTKWCKIKKDATYFFSFSEGDEHPTTTRPKKNNPNDRRLEYHPLYTLLVGLDGQDGWAVQVEE